MEKILYPNHPVRCIITGPSECGKSVFLTNLILNIINEYDKMYIYSPSLHQDIYQKLSKCFSSYIPIHIIPNNLNEEDIDIVIEEVVNNKDFEKSNTEIETFDNIEDLKFPQEYENNSIFILDDLNQKEIKSSMDMSLREFKLLTSSCWNENYQPLTIDMTKDKYTGRYRLGLNSIFVPDSNLF